MHDRATPKVAIFIHGILYPGPFSACERRAFFMEKENMAQKFDAAALVTSPMKCVSILLPEVLISAIDKAAFDEDPSAPNRSSWIRGAVIGRLRREAA